MNSLINELLVDLLVCDLKPVLLNELKEAAIYAINKVELLDGESSESIANKYITRCENKLLPLSDFDWLNKKNIRQCNFVWATLFKHNIRPAKNLKNTKNDAKKYIEIISWIDNTQGIAKEKIKLMDTLKFAWENATDYKNYGFDFLKPKNISQCEKAIVFIQKKISVKSKAYYFKPPLIASHEISTSYYRFLLSVDMWDAAPETKAVFYKKMKDANRKWFKPTNKVINKIKNKPIDLSDKQLDKQLDKTNDKHKSIDVSHGPEIDVSHGPEIDVSHEPEIDVSHEPEIDKNIKELTLTRGHKKIKIKVNKKVTYNLKNNKI